MILSFHPTIEGDKNILVAGRAPDGRDMDAIRNAHAVILPQGCPPELHRMARTHCAHVFPNYDTRFRYPGKLNQIRLFREYAIAHPESLLFDSFNELQTQTKPSIVTERLGFPLVLKFDWGGEGDTVFPVRSFSELDAAMERIRLYEKTGQFGFLFQKWVSNHQAVLRVVIIGKRLTAYWRINDQPDVFGGGLAQGGRVDHEHRADLQKNAMDVADKIRAATGMNLAGLDFLFEKDCSDPLCIEVNYFFGRRGLGGTDAFLRILQEEVNEWIEAISLGSMNDAVFDDGLDARHPR